MDGDHPSFDGRYHSINDPICEPRPIQKPRPPILIGGGGEKRTLKMVAKYADAWNIISYPEMVKHKLEVLEKHCEDVGRDPATIEKTKLGLVLIGRNEADLKAKVAKYDPDNFPEAYRVDNIVGTADQCIERCNELLDMGLDTLMFMFPDAHTLEGMQLFMEEVAPALRGR